MRNIANQERCGMNRKPTHTCGAMRRLICRLLPGLVIVAAALATTACRTTGDRVSSAVRAGRDSSRTFWDSHDPPPRFIEPEASLGTPEERLPSGEISLEQARVLALDHSPDVDAAYARLLASRAAIEEARANFFPVVRLTHKSSRTFLIPASRNRLASALVPTQPFSTDISNPNFPFNTFLNTIASPLFSNSSPGGDANSFSEHSSAFTASWILFNGFVREAELLASESAFRASQSVWKDVRRLLIQAVDTAYYQIQLATEQIRIAKADEEFSRKQYEETRKLQQAGRATQADVDNFHVRVLDAQTTTTIATNARRTGKVVLAELLGIDGAMLPDDARVSKLAEESDEEMSAADPDEWIGKGLANRPDIVQAEHELERGRRNLQAVQGLYLPTVSVSGSWGYDRLSNMRYRNDDQSAAGSLEVRWDLFAGGVRGARVRIARSVIADLAARLRRRKIAVQSEVRQAIIDLADAQQRIRLQSESLETARENRRIVEAGYLAGNETLNRLNEAQRDFVAAQVNLAQARINLRQAWTDLFAAAASQDLPLTRATGATDDAATAEYPENRPETAP